MTTQKSSKGLARNSLWDSFRKAAVQATFRKAAVQKKAYRDTPTTPIKSAAPEAGGQTTLATRAWRVARRATRIGLLSVPIVAAFGGVASSKLLFVETFDNGIDSGWARELCCSHSAQIVSPSGLDNRAIKFTFRKADYLRNGTGKRAELKLREYYPIGSERWYKFSMYIPTTWQNTKKGFIINQFGQRPDAGESGRVPALFLVTDGQKLNLGSRWDPRRFTTSKDSIQGESWDLGSLPKGRWVNLVYHVKWSYKSDGILELYVDGKKVVAKRGPNCYSN